MTTPYFLREMTLWVAPARKHVSLVVVYSCPGIDWRLSRNSIHFATTATTITRAVRCPPRRERPFFSHLENPATTATNRIYNPAGLVQTTGKASCATRVLSRCSLISLTMSLR